eukprot:1816595-Rhodomonas_salina.1
MYSLLSVRSVFFLARTVLQLDSSLLESMIILEIQFLPSDSRSTTGGIASLRLSQMYPTSNLVNT